MIIGIKESIKLIGISIVACCAVFVCTLFLNYNLDLAAIEGAILTQAGQAMYQAQVSLGKVIAAVTGGCLVITSVIMLLFYIKNYIDTHGKELAILKALGYSNLTIARHFWVFGLSILAGSLPGYAAAFCYLPSFYKTQNAENLFPALPVQFHPLLACLLVLVPAAAFAILAIAYAGLKLKQPVLDLLHSRRTYKTKINKPKTKELPFLQDLQRTVLRGKKTLVFFVAFSAFCFSAMLQMALSMDELASASFAILMVTIGLILAFATLFLSLSGVVRGNAKTIAMMRVLGYSPPVCSRAVLGGYRPFAYIGFAIGSIYQYVLLKLTLTFIFADLEQLPEYRFNFNGLLLTLAAFILTYEIILSAYSRKIKHISLKSIMLES